MNSLYLFMLGLMALPASETTTEYVFNPIGIWIIQSEGVAVSVDKCQGGLCGKIVWIADGGSQYDVNNEDESLSCRALCGLEIVNGLQPSDHVNIYKGGKIYSPSDGKMHDAKMVLLSSDSIDMRSYTGVSQLGDTQTWERVSVSDYPPCTPVAPKVVSYSSEESDENDFIENHMDNVGEMDAVEVKTINADSAPLNIVKMNKENGVNIKEKMVSKVKKTGNNFNSVSKFDEENNNRIYSDFKNKAKVENNAPRVLSLEVDE